jgi:hypothetical protein
MKRLSTGLRYFVIEGGELQGPLHSHPFLPFPVVRNQDLDHTKEEENILGNVAHSSRRIKIYFEMYEIWLKAKKEDSVRVYHLPLETHFSTFT